MSYREYVPSQPLRQYVDCYWHYVSGQAAPAGQLPIQRCLPLGSIEIILQVDGMMADIFDNTRQQWEKSFRIYFAGMYTDTAFWRAQPGTLLFGIRLKPESLLPLFGIPPALLLNSVVDAEAVLGISAGHLYDEMAGVFDMPRLVSVAERHLQQRLGKLAPNRNYVAEACRLIRDSGAHLTVEQLSDAIYISKRQLERHFKLEFGASPKTYQRIIRFRNAYRYARSWHSDKIHWADVSYESGYADQAHFIRDFKAFTGHAPSALLSDRQSFFQTLESVVD